MFCIAKASEEQANFCSRWLCRTAAGSSLEGRVGGLRQGTFAGPQQVLDYVGRYTHRVAISNHRLLNMENAQVRFRWKDIAITISRKPD